MENYLKIIVELIYILQKIIKVLYINVEIIENKKNYEIV